MDHDQKIGLALGVLLVGAAGAFFFRNESVIPESPSLQSSSEINDRIRQRPNAPYLVEPKLPTAILRDAKNSEESAQSVKQAAVNPKVGRSTPTPDPIPFDIEPIGAKTAKSADAERTIRTAPIDHKIPGDVPRNSAPVASGSGESRQQGEGRFHTVQAGDTLSSISQQYYGTSARFADIYTANRDVMSDVNTLRPNLRLRIPEFPGRSAEMISSRPRD